MVYRVSSSLFLVVDASFGFCCVSLPPFLRPNFDLALSLLSLKYTLSTYFIVIWIHRWLYICMFRHILCDTYFNQALRINKYISETVTGIVV